MLEKSPGNWHVDKLRTILLYEVDFNLVNKKFGWNALRQAEPFNKIDPKQYGSHQRGQQQAICQALNKRLTFEVIHQ